MEKSWHQKKRESLWSAGHQYSLWAPPLTFRFVAKPICLDLSRVLPREAFGPPALGFPPNLSQSPNPPDPKLTSQSSHTDKNYHHHYHHHHRSLSASLYFHKGIVHWLNCTEVARSCYATNWSHWDIWRGIDWNEGNIYQTINVIIKYYWSCYLNVYKNRRIEEIKEFCIILWILHVLDESFYTKLFLDILTFPQLVSDLLVILL